MRLSKVWCWQLIEFQFSHRIFIGLCNYFIFVIGHLTFPLFEPVGNKIGNYCKS